VKVFCPGQMVLTWAQAKWKKGGPTPGLQTRFRKHDLQDIQIVEAL
jgi:hypothetical protein